MEIHFGADDLSRVRIVARPDPLWELVLSVHQLQHAERAPALRPWLSAAHVAARRPDVAGAIATLVDVDPDAGYFPDFLTPTPKARGMAQAVGEVLSTPRERVRDELAQLATYVDLPSWLHGLADGEPAMLIRLGQAMRTYQRAVLDPWQYHVQAEVSRDWAVRMTALAEGGVEGLLESFEPVMRWQAPVLHAHFPPQRVHLGGRGLLLVPSYFCRRHPVMLADPGLAPVLVYPVRHADDLGAAPEPLRSLRALVGATRARVLVSVGPASTTGELASRLRMAPSSASEHVGVLRDAGLVSSRRRANSVIHTLTPLGHAILAPTHT